MIAGLNTSQHHLKSPHTRATLALPTIEKTNDFKEMKRN